MVRVRGAAMTELPHPDCHPDRCPCDDGFCTLGRYARTTATEPGTTDGPGHHTLVEAERQVAERLAGTAIDMDAMAAVSNVYRAANSVRNHLERSVLAPHDLTWTGWIVLWVVWIWGDMETRHVAAEAGISKGTLTGVVSTLEHRGLAKRRTHPDDARRVLLALTPKGRKLVTALLPQFNAEEAFVTSGLTGEETLAMARSLRKVVTKAEG